MPAPPFYAIQLPSLAQTIELVENLALLFVPFTHEEVGKLTTQSFLHYISSLFYITSKTRTLFSDVSYLKCYRPLVTIPVLLLLDRLELEMLFIFLLNGTLGTGCQK